MKTSVPEDGAKEVDMSQLISGYGLECIGRTGLGRSFGAMDEDGTEYSRALRQFGCVCVIPCRSAAREVLTVGG